MTEDAIKRKEVFIRKKKGIRSEADILAQRLINIYRQLGVLGADATEKYNQMLLKEVTPEVMVSFRSIPGGEEVREYYNFLSHTDDEEAEENSTNAKTGLALLPKAEQLSPLWENFGSAAGGIGGLGGGNAQNPIAMTVVDPIRASVVTASSAPAGSFASGVDVSLLQQEIDDALTDGFNRIMEPLNFVVIDSNVDKMHQNLKKAKQEASEQFEGLKAQLQQVVLDVAEKSAFPRLPEAQSNRSQNASQPKSATRLPERSYKKKYGQKFSVDMTEDDE